MSEDRKARDAVEHAGEIKPSAKNPPAGPHAKPHLNDDEKTPGSGALTDHETREIDAGPD